MKRFFSYLRNKPERTRRRMLYTILIVIMVALICYWIYDLSNRQWGSLDFPFKDFTSSLPAPPEIDLADEFIAPPPPDPSFVISEEFTVER